MTKIKFKTILVFFLTLIMISSISQPNAGAYQSLETNSTEERPKVVTYMSITEDWTRQLLRNVEADIYVLVSGTEDIHSYDPSSDATLMMDGADLFVRLNIPIEAYAEQISSQFPSVPTADLWVNITEDPKWGYAPRSDPVWQHPANPPNMHMWTSPSIARNFVHRLAERLKETIGTTEIINETIDANLEAYDLQLINTIEWMTKLSETPEYIDLKLVPFHPSFIYYLEDDLNLERVAVIEEKPGVEVSLTHLEYLREKINDSCTIIWHPQESIGQEYARDLSMETGAEMTMLTPLIPIDTPSEWEPKFGSQIDTFLEMVEFNTYQLTSGAPYMEESSEESIPGFEIILFLPSLLGISSLIIIKWKKRTNIK